MLKSSLRPDDFLSQYWQQKPYLFKAALSGFKDPLSPEELAGLACEEEVESRLVQHTSDTWQLRHGPFTETDFTSLPDTDWTLLVQAVDQWFTELKGLYRHFDFLPDWRFDDIMVSYATANAGVGPHFDYYDVFIIQGAGQRRWQLGQHCDENTALAENTELKILAEFHAENEFLMATGDVLYIPAGLSHQGISLDQSLSYSIGFRAPSYVEILEELCSTASQTLREDQRYADPQLQELTASAEITDEVIDKLRQIISSCVDNRKLVISSFGENITRRKYPEQQFVPEEALNPEQMKQHLSRDMQLEKHPAARFAFHQQNGLISLFADGLLHEIDSKEQSLMNLVNMLCDKKQQLIPAGQCLESDATLSLCCNLYNQGTLIPAENIPDQES